MGHQRRSATRAGWRGKGCAVFMGSLRVTSVVEPACDLVRVEPYEAPPLHIGHALLGDEPADVADGDTEVIGELVDGEKVREGLCRRHWSSVLARETAIAESLRRQLARSDAPAVARTAVEAAIAAAESNLGAQLSEEQSTAVLAICTSGRGAELIEGVAGAGKTTMLTVVAAAFTEAGCEVIGTATSGQAARNLSSEADIGQSRTLASLIWRLDHHQLSLTERTAVILDEVGMTDDVDLVRLGALVSRHPSAVHHLVENRRQHDPEEREALAALRDGEVAEAISFYLGHDHIHVKADREEALQAAVNAWSADVAAGHRVGLYAWRRANVAELNALARSWMEFTGRLSGPELVCPGGKAYRAGDEVVTLAPGPGGTLVTSERAVVERASSHLGHRHRSARLRSGDEGSGRRSLRRREDARRGCRPRRDQDRCPRSGRYRAARGLSVLGRDSQCP